MLYKCSLFSVIINKIKNLYIDRIRSQTSY